MCPPTPAPPQIPPPSQPPPSPSSPPSHPLDPSSFLPADLPAPAPKEARCISLPPHSCLVCSCLGRGSRDIRDGVRASHGRSPTEVSRLLAGRDVRWT